MTTEIELAIAAAVMKTASTAFWWCLRRLRENTRDKLLIDSLRAAGPGTTVVDRRADGRILMIWTHGREQDSMGAGDRATALPGAGGGQGGDC